MWNTSDAERKGRSRKRDAQVCQWRKPGRTTRSAICSSVSGTPARVDTLPVASSISARTFAVTTVPSGAAAPPHEGHWPDIGVCTSEDVAGKRQIAIEHPELAGATLDRLRREEDTSWFNASSAPRQG